MHATLATERAISWPEMGNHYSVCRKEWSRVNLQIYFLCVIQVLSMISNYIIYRHGNLLDSDIHSYVLDMDLYSELVWLDCEL